jgi:hypothetical protein
VLPEANDCASAVVNLPLPQPRSHQDWGRAHSMMGVRMRAVASLIFISELYFQLTRRLFVTNVFPNQGSLIQDALVRSKSLQRTKKGAR